MSAAFINSERDIYMIQTFMTKYNFDGPIPSTAFARRWNGSRPFLITFILAIGAGLLVVNFQHLFEEEQLFALLFGGVIPVAISLSIVGVGLYLWWAGWQASSLSVLTGWFLAGLVLMTLFGVIVTGYQLHEGGSSPHVGYVILLYPTYGSIPALITGRYDVQRRVRERSLRRHRDFMTQIEELAGIGGWELDPTTGEIEYTEGASHLRELSDSSLTLEEVIESFNEEDREMIRRAIRHCVEDEIPYDVEGQITTEEGNHRWVRVRGECVDNDGEKTVIGAIQDITLSKQREQRIMVLNRVLRHNLRNDLTIIKGHAELLGEKLAQLLGDIDTGEFDPAFEAAITEIRTVSDDLSQDLGNLRTVFDEMESLDVASLQAHTETIQKTSNGMLTLAEKANRFEEAIETGTV